MSESKPEIKLVPVTLKHVEPPEEKIVLPTAQDIESEKQHITFVNGVESFDKKYRTVDFTCRTIFNGRWSIRAHARASRLQKF